MASSRPGRKAAIRTTKSLSAGRASRLTVSKYSNSNLSSSKSRKIIRNHHILSKSHAQAVKDGDKSRAAQLQAQIEAHGGLERYQEASKAGQNIERGGDSSTVLMAWLGPVKAAQQATHTSNRLRLLEVGALSVNNDCSRSGYFDVTRIDLNSQNPGIMKQDFMKRPLPKRENELFDCISLSLVVNFVPEPRLRGDMLRRVPKFLKSPLEHAEESVNESGRDMFPSLFLVLPAPCVMNSRYLNQDRLTAIMQSIGFRLESCKMTAKLVYYLWVFGEVPIKKAVFPKTELNPGKSRNNFAIVVGT